MDEYDLIVIGGGIAGSYTAYGAAKNRLNVCVIEASKYPNGATTKSGGIVTRLLDDIDDALLATISLRLIKEIIDDDNPEIIHKGYICIEDYDDAENDLKNLKKIISDLKILLPDEARDQWPFINLYDKEVVLYSPSDITIEPDKFMEYLWSKLGDIGVEIYKGVTVKSLIVKDGAVYGVKTTSHNYYSKNVVIAVGAWAYTFLEKYGIKIKRWIMSVPLFKFDIGDDNNIIGVWDENNYSYWRPSINHTFIGGEYDAYPISKPEDGFKKPPYKSLEYIVTLFKRRFRFRRWKLMEGWSGPISLTRNYKPISMEISKIKGLYLIDGLGGMGLMRGPAIGYHLGKYIAKRNL